MRTAITAGFTLIELSIVLVIIALLAGGILEGMALIRAAQYRAQISEIDALKLAVTTFELKFDCLPGDCPKATSFFSGALNGNGDGRINIGMTCANIDPVGGDQDFSWNASSDACGELRATEWINVYDQLSAAGMISFPRYDEATTYPAPGVVSPLLKFAVSGGPSDVITDVFLPSMAVGYVSGFKYVSSGHKIALGAVGAWIAGQSAGINGWDAYAIDGKIDDGLPYSGTVVVMNAGYIYRPPNYCIIGGVYPTQDNPPSNVNGPYGPICALYINAGF